MKYTIVVDEVGRLVLPKTIRDLLGISGRATVQLEVINGSLQITLPESAGRLERRGKRRVFAGKIPSDWDSGQAVVEARTRRVQK